MKKLVSVVLSLTIVFTFGAFASFAEGEDSGITQTTTITESTQADAANSETEAAENTAAGITPESILYPLDKMLESIQVTLTFSTDGKAELLVSIANERLAEADILTERKRQELLGEVMEAYIKTIKKAKENVKDAAEDGVDSMPVLEEIKITESTAEKLVIKATGILPQEVKEKLEQAVTDEVKETIVVQAFAISKLNFSDAKKLLKEAQEELKEAVKSGDEKAIAEAKEKLAKAEQYKEEMEKAKDEVEAYKEKIKAEIEDKDEAEDEDEDEDKAEAEDEDNGEKEQKRIEHKEAQKAQIASKKISQLTEIIKKQEAKREEIINKLKEHSGKASAKIEENTKKQIEKRNGKIEEWKKSLPDTDENEDEGTTEEESILQQENSGDNTADEPAAPIVKGQGKGKGNKKGN